MQKEIVEICPCCGQRTIKRRHCLNAILVRALSVLAAEGNGCAKLREIEPFLNKSEYNNFQKLQYFGLIEKIPRTRYWKITEVGVNFLNGNTAAPSYVWVRNKMVLDTMIGPGIYVNDARLLTSENEMEI